MYININLGIKKVVLVILIFLAAGCTSQEEANETSLTSVTDTPHLIQEDPTATSFPSATITLPATQEDPTATSLPPVKATETPKPTSSPIPCSQTTEFSAGDEWDYVVIGDSITYGFLDTPPSGYAGYLEQDLGVKVSIHNWGKDGWSGDGMLDALRTNVKLRQAVCDAEVVIFEVPRKAFDSPGYDFAFGNPGGCGGTDNQNCLRKALELYQAHVDGIISEIVSLRSPSEALIRTFDAHTYWPVAETKANGTNDVLIYYWAAANDYLLEVAAEYQIPVARVYEAFNGTNGDEDPFEKGYVGGYSGDDFSHPNTLGKEIMADLMRALGYEYAP